MEELWSQIKRISHDFSGLNFQILDGVKKNGEHPKDYIDNWICTALFFSECEMKKFSNQDKRNYLNEILCLKN